MMPVAQLILDKRANPLLKSPSAKLIGIRIKSKPATAMTMLSHCIFCKRSSRISQALTEYPEVNSSLKGDEIEIYGNVNMGIAVATERGLIVPVLRNADEKPLVDISKESSLLIQRTQDGKIGLDELSFGTFTITNLGTFGIDLFTPIINQPESAILGVGKLDRKVKVVDGDKIAIRSVMNLCLVFDHRVIDGAPAARFLGRVKELLENPVQMKGAK